MARGRRSSRSREPTKWRPPHRASSMPREPVVDRQPKFYKGEGPRRPRRASSAGPGRELELVPRGPSFLRRLTTVLERLDDAISAILFPPAWILLGLYTAMWAWLLYQEASAFGQQAVVARITHQICDTKIATILPSAFCTLESNGSAPVAILTGPDPLGLEQRDALLDSMLGVDASSTSISKLVLEARDVRSWAHQSQYVDALPELAAISTRIVQAFLPVEKALIPLQTHGRESMQGLLTLRSNLDGAVRLLKALGAPGGKIISLAQRVFPLLFPVTLSGAIASELTAFQKADYEQTVDMLNHTTEAALAVDDLQFDADLLKVALARSMKDLLRICPTHIYWHTSQGMTLQERYDNLEGRHNAVERVKAGVDKLSEVLEKALEQQRGLREKSLALQESLALTFRVPHLIAVEDGEGDVEGVIVRLGALLGKYAVQGEARREAGGGR